MKLPKKKKITSANASDVAKKLRAAPPTIHPEKGLRGIQVRRSK